MNRLLVTCLTLSAATAASAHHSPAAYDAQRSITLTGSVVRYEWGNPHVYIHVRSADNPDTVWEVEAGSPTVMERAGWTSTSLREGDQVTVQANPARSATRRTALLTAIQTASGSFAFERGTPAPPAVPDNPVAAASLSGNWLPLAPAFFGFVGPPPSDWPLTERAEAAFARHTDSQNGSQNCVSLSAPFLMVWHDLKQIELGEQTTIVRAALIDDIEREIHMNAEADDDVAATNQGYSVGRWDADALVVETTRFLEHASGVREGVPSSPEKRLIERFALSPDRTRLTYSYELVDPVYLTRPVTGSIEWIHRPDLRYTGYECDRDVAGRFLENE